MPKFMFEKRFYIPEELKISPKLVLLFEPDEALSGIYNSHLRNAAFAVVRTPSREELLKLSLYYEPDLIICSLEPSATEMLNLIKRIKHHLPHLFIMTLGSGALELGASKLLDLGVSAHINRNLTKPIDVVLTAHELLHYST